MGTLNFPKKFPLKGKKRIGHDFLLYDFSEKVEIKAFTPHPKLKRPVKPIQFYLNMEKIEVWYQGPHPFLVCSCEKGSHPQGCAHRDKLVRLFLPQLIQDIFEYYDRYFSKDYLGDEVAMKIRLIHPKSEKPVYQKAA